MGGSAGRNGRLCGGRPPAPSEQRILTHSIRHEKQHRKRDYIPDENRCLHPLDEWMQREDPTTAQTVVLATDSVMLEIAKKDLPGELKFKNAQKAAAKYRRGFRCATRHEAIEMYDARFRGLDEAFEKIGGKPATNGYWTSEADPDPECYSNSALIYNSIAGCIFNYTKPNNFAVRPVCDFKSR
jgi:hypothetical protein